MIHEKLNKQIPSFQAFTDYADDNSLEETKNMASFIELSLSAMIKFEPTELETLKEKLHKYKIENTILTKNN